MALEDALDPVRERPDGGASVSLAMIVKDFIDSRAHRLKVIIDNRVAAPRISATPRDHVRANCGRCVVASHTMQLRDDLVRRKLVSTFFAYNVLRCGQDLQVTEGV
jgi:hypothetical protein